MKILTGAMALVVALALAAAPALAQGRSSSGTEMKSSKGGASGAGMSGNTDQVKAVQQALKDQGLDPGPIDGKMGAKTKAALRDYQQKQGLKATGRLDAETAAKLGVEKKTSAGSSSTSPASSPSTSAPASSDTKTKK
jgi:peptidoglycan hydrolase-like protein with peptidoglycan-binding domain